jgi:D-alanyl-D-alanine carboxypeptidase
MTSGIFSFTEDDGLNQAYIDNLLETLTPEQEVQIAITHPPYFLPGLEYHYSDTDYTS